MNLSMLLLTAPVGQRRTVLMKVPPTVQLVRDPRPPERSHVSSGPGRLRIQQEDQDFSGGPPHEPAATDPGLRVDV